MASLDPYLLLALETGFRDYVPRYDAVTPLDFILELAEDGAGKLAALAGARSDVLVNEAHLLAPSSFVTARMPLAALEELIEDHAIAAVELAESLCHQRTLCPKDTPFADALRTGAALKVDRTSSTLAAIIDDGCPFAHAEFRKANGPGTRIVALWDMDTHPEFLAAQTGAPTGFFRGREVPGQQLDAWMAEATEEGVLDELACYRAAGYSTVLRSSLTHGSHLLGRLAGPRYRRGTAGDEPASAADIAFLQIPRRSMEAPDAGSMHACILDALRYLRRIVDENGYERCVVTCAMGSMLGPHDGDSLFERALDRFLGETGKPFSIVFAAGNGNGQRLHAELSPAPKESATVLWVLPGDNESAAFAELWAAAGANETFKVSAEGRDQPLTLNKAVQVGAGLVALHTPGRLTLRSAPTRSPDSEAPAAGPGFATIEVHWQGASTVHGYVAWGGENLGCPRSTRQTEWRAPPDADNTTVHGNGTLLGDACGMSDAIYIAGGYVGANNPAYRVRADYSSTGPTRAKHRKGPTFLALSDESAAVQGIPGTGTRSPLVSEFVWGTSVAAPQVARALINGEKLPSRDTTTPPPRDVPALPPEEEVGSGFLP